MKKIYSSTKARCPMKHEKVDLSEIGKSVASYGFVYHGPGKYPHPGTPCH